MAPRPPRGVVVTADGVEQPVALVYAGRRRGLDRWIAEFPVRHREPLTVRVAHPVVGSSVAVDVVDHVPPALRR